MIKTRSPYYITAPLTNSNTTAVTLTIKVNSQTENTSLSAPDYSVTKNRPSINASYLDFEISNIIRDKFEHKPIYNTSTGLLNSEQLNVLQLNYSLSYTGSGGDLSVLNSDVLDGYGYFLEGINPQVPTNKFLLSNDYYLINKNGYFNVPIYNDGTYSTVSVDGTPYTLTESTQISTKVKNLWLNGNDFSGNFLVEMGGNSITLEVEDECKYSPNDVIFLNKSGAWEIMTFFKTSRESVQFDKNNFKNNFVANGSYDITRHTYKDYNLNGREKITMNSGFVPESYNETVRQLLLSEHVYILKATGEFIPVNLETSSYQYKTRIIDKLISHELDFNYAFDLVNNI